MRFALDKLGALYKTQLGQDVIETLIGAGASAGGQALFTEMTPEQIALSTAIGIGAATVGRPIIGRTGQMIGSRIKNPGLNKFAEEFVNPDNAHELLRDIVAAKVAPFKHLSAPAQVGQLLGRQYGDNIAQGIVAVAVPGLMPTSEKDEQN